MSALTTEWLHELLHKLPGLPSHSEADRLNHNLSAQPPSDHNRDSHHPALAGRHPALGNSDRHHAGSARVLVAWQNWIGELFAGRAGRR